MGRGGDILKSEPCFAAVCGNASLLNAAVKRNDAHYFTDSLYNPLTNAATPGKYFAMALATAIGNTSLFTRKPVAAFVDYGEVATLIYHNLKRLISLSDMVKSGEAYSDEMWDEKIGDSINYLLLLRAIVADDGGEM